MNLQNLLKEKKAAIGIKARIRERVLREAQPL